MFHALVNGKHAHVSPPDATAAAPALRTCMGTRMENVSPTRCEGRTYPVAGVPLQEGVELESGAARGVRRSSCPRPRRPTSTLDHGAGSNGIHAPA